MSALEFMLLHMLAFRHAADAELALAADSTESSPVSAAFQEYVLLQAEHLLQGVTAFFLATLRRLQRAEEDAAFASLRAARPGAAGVPRRFDIEALFLYPFAVAFDELGAFTLAAVVLFLFNAFFIADAYVWRRGGFEWD